MTYIMIEDPLQEPEIEHWNNQTWLDFFFFRFEKIKDKSVPSNLM